MTWVLVAAAWLLLGTVAALVIARGIRIADRHAREQAADRHVDPPDVTPRQGVAPPRAGARSPRS